jgi:F-type H+-transporting ATPase subunit delta
MKVSKVAERYAQSLFELSRERKEEDAVYADILQLQKVCQENKEFRTFLKSPVVHSDKKRAIINDIFGATFRKLTINFISILIRKNREAIIPEIAESFIEQFKDDANILTVIFKAAVPPTEAIRKQVLEIMKTYTNARIDLVVESDPSVIGGFLLSWKDLQYDATISHQVERLKRGVARVNLYVKEI